MTQMTDICPLPIKSKISGDMGGVDIGHAKTEQTVYIEKTPMFVRLIAFLGIRSILHTDYTSTCEKLASFGFED